MKIRIQNTNEGLRVRETWNEKEYKKEISKNSGKVEGSVIIAAEYFLTRFPRFKEMIINTDFTDDV